jgi:aminoglycoside phosphotransferase (APT) family kinase protein
VGPDAGWIAERPCGPDRARRLISAAFPDLRDVPVAPLAEGWDNTVFLVGGRWAFRFPRRAIAVPGLRRELTALPRLAERLPLPIPVPELVALDEHPTDPWPFTGARFLTGHELPDARLPERDRALAAEAVGGFLRTLHAVDPRTVSVELPVDPMQRGWPRARVRDTRELLGRLDARRIWLRDPQVDELLAEAEALEAPTGEPVLVHGDLHVRHLLIDARGHAAGVIDWGDVCSGHPALDVSLAYTAFTGDSRAAFLAAYGGIDPETELRARALGVRLSALLVDHAVAVGNRFLLDEAIAGLRRGVT